eukprot:534328-Pelagomonas_calceolata.AAC.1
MSALESGSKGSHCMCCHHELIQPKHIECLHNAIMFRAYGHASPQITHLNGVVHHEVREHEAALLVNGAMLVCVSVHHAHCEAQNDLVLVHEAVHVTPGGLGHQGQAVLEGVLQGAIAIKGRECGLGQD